MNRNQEEWNQFGFHYTINDDEKVWIFTGTKSGLKKFYSILVEYTSDERNNIVSEHAHYGPDFYLEIMTWPEAQINDHCICGTFDDLKRLAKTFLEKLMQTEVGKNFVINSQYTDKAAYSIRVNVV